MIFVWLYLFLISKSCYHYVEVNDRLFIDIWIFIKLIVKRISDTVSLWNEQYPVKGLRFLFAWISIQYFSIRLHFFPCFNILFHLLFSSSFNMVVRFSAIADSLKLITNLNKHMTTKTFHQRLKYLLIYCYIFRIVCLCFIVTKIIPLLLNKSTNKHLVLIISFWSFSPRKL